MVGAGLDWWGEAGGVEWAWAGAGAGAGQEADSGRMEGSRELGGNPAKEMTKTCGSDF